MAIPVKCTKNQRAVDSDDCRKCYEGGNGEGVTRCQCKINNAGGK